MTKRKVYILICHINHVFLKLFFNLKAFKKKKMLHWQKSYSLFRFEENMID